MLTETEMLDFMDLDFILCNLLLGTMMKDSDLLNELGLVLSNRFTILNQKYFNKFYAGVGR